MRKRVYGKAMKTGWGLTLIGIIGIVAGFKLAGSTGNTGFFALTALGLLLVISGLVTVGVYAAMEWGVSQAFHASSPLLRFTIAARDYAAFTAAEAAEIRGANKMSLVIALIFCGLVAVGGPFLVKDNGIIYTCAGAALALILLFFSWIITRYRINKLKTADREVILTPDGAYVGGQFNLWKPPVSFLSEAAYFDAGTYQTGPMAVIRITYSAVTRTIVTPYTIVIPVPAGMEEKAKAAVNALQGKVKK